MPLAEPLPMEKQALRDWLVAQGYEFRGTGILAPVLSRPLRGFPGKYHMLPAKCKFCWEKLTLDNVCFCQDGTLHCKHALCARLAKQ